MDTTIRELTCLKISIKQTINSFEKDLIEIESKGVNMKETIKGLNYLLKIALERIEVKK